jgi:Tfp pilus assembly protein PilX
MNSTISKKTLKQQQGAVLISALMFMIIMTMLAITSMGTNTLEERMAANAATSNLSFQGAEAGLEVITNHEKAFDTSGHTITDADYAGQGITVTSSTTYQQQTIAARGKTPSDSSTSYHHMDFKGEVSGGGIPTVLHSGGYKLGPKIQ